MADVVAAVAILTAFGWTFLLLPVQIIAVALDLRLCEHIPVVYHRGLCWLFGLDRVRIGRINRSRPTLFVVNHCSYFDIPVLASLLRASFVAKIEVRSWPLLGLLARLQNTIFVARRVAATRTSRDVIAARLRAGHNLILFPEGTTSDGNRVLPFFSGLMAIAGAPLRGTDLMVQPVTISYVRENGIPIGYARRSRFSWYGDMALARHFWQAMRGGRLRVEVRFHPPIAARAFSDRKQLTRYCYRQVAAGLERSLHRTDRGRAVLDAPGGATHTRGVSALDAA